MTHDKIAQVCGAASFRVTEPGEPGEPGAALSRALDKTGPAVVEVVSIQMR